MERALRQEGGWLLSGFFIPSPLSEIPLTCGCTELLYCIPPSSFGLVFVEEFVFKVPGIQGNLSQMCWLFVVLGSVLCHPLEGQQL